MRKVAKIAAIIIVLMIAAVGLLNLRQPPDPFIITRGELIFYHTGGNEAKAEVGIHGRILLKGQRGIAIGQYGFRIIEPCPMELIGP